MLDSTHPLAELLRRDDRYQFDAYVFVFDALRYAQEKLDMGRVVAGASPHDGVEDELFDGDEYDSSDDGEEDLNLPSLDDEDDEKPRGEERHVTGQELCEAMRRFALDQYGLLARSVLGHWGVNSTGDFGEIVFNLIDIGQMRKTEHDRREDFDDVYDFDEALCVEAVFADASTGDEGANA